ncbi:hypothetical protein [Radicibacter daui]|uniref:hypothetical protein n=1 Tax=Radicibacter daui TaxID=3064829 RepID=UPI004046F2A2
MRMTAARRALRLVALMAGIGGFFALPAAPAIAQPVRELEGDELANPPRDNLVDAYIMTLLVHANRAAITLVLVAPPREAVEGDVLISLDDAERLMSRSIGFVKARQLVHVKLRQGMQGQVTIDLPSRPLGAQTMVVVETKTDFRRSNPF